MRTQQVRGYMHCFCSCLLALFLLYVICLRNPKLDKRNPSSTAFCVIGCMLPATTTSTGFLFAAAIIFIFPMLFFIFFLYSYSFRSKIARDVLLACICGAWNTCNISWEWSSAYARWVEPFAGLGGGVSAVLMTNRVGEIRFLIKYREPIIWFTKNKPA